MSRSGEGVEYAQMNLKHVYKSDKVPNQDIEAVFTELYRLKPIINSNDEYHKNYIIIRLVTIIEQFMRTTIEDKLYTNPDKIPTQIPLNPLVIDEIGNRSPMKKKITKELIVSASLPFQNTKSISDELKQHKIVIFDDDTKKLKNNNAYLKRDDYDKLFNLRHGLVHTLNKPSCLNVSHFFVLTEVFIQHIIDNHGDKGFFHYMKIIALMNLNRYDEALNCFNKIKQDLDDIIYSQPDNIDPYITKAVILVELKKYEDALSCYNKVITLKPTARMYVLKGQTLNELGRNEDALACFDKAMDLGRNDADIYIMKGLSLLLLNKNRLAADCFDAALCLYPDNAILHFGLGKSLHRLACNEEAVKCLRKALQLDFKRSEVYFSLGALLYKLKQYAEATKHLNQALLLNSDANTHYLLGLSLQKLGKTEESVMHIKQASQLDPSIRESVLDSEDL